MGAGQRYGLQRCLFAGVSVFAPADNADRHSWFNRCPDGSPLRRKALEIAGVDVTLIYAGAHKVDGNPYSQLPGDVRDEFQLSINSTREQFAQKSRIIPG